MFGEGTSIPYVEYSLADDEQRVGVGVSSNTSSCNSAFVKNKWHCSSVGNFSIACR